MRNAVQAEMYFGGSAKPTVYDHILDALAEARACDDAIGEAERRVNAMLSKDCPEVLVIDSFRIEDDLNFGEWHVLVQYPGGARVALTHES